MCVYVCLCVYDVYMYERQMYVCTYEEREGGRGGGERKGDALYIDLAKDTRNDVLQHGDEVGG